LQLEKNRYPAYRANKLVIYKSIWHGAYPHVAGRVTTMGYRLMVSNLCGIVALNFSEAVAILLLIFKNATGMLQNGLL
jgi:hypothetical protein